MAGGDGMSRGRADHRERSRRPRLAFHYPGNGDMNNRGVGQTGTGSPEGLVQEALENPPSPDAIRQLEDAFGRPPRKTGRAYAIDSSHTVELDYDDVIQQSFPASDPPPPPG